MTNITIGQVSGAINFAILIAQITFPLALVIVLAGILQPANTAVTWSVVSRYAHSTLWPTLLSSDSASVKGVDRRVTCLSVFSTFALVVLAIAGVVTPLGLSEDVAPTQAKNVAFRYAQDTGPFGQGLESRDDYVFSRLCGFYAYIACPSQPWPKGFTQNETGLYAPGENVTVNVSPAIPKNLTEIFSSATNRPGSTVAGLFDIQYRSYSMQLNPEGTHNIINKRRPYVKGLFRMFESLVLNNRYQVIEGLVVDTIDGGIGFRNHTIPDDVPLGGKWEEDLLWVTPDTSCVNMNLTLEYTLTGGISDPRIVFLRDNGGFRNLVNHYPYIDLNDTQGRPALQDRAFKAASIQNIKLMQYLNLTRNMDFPEKINMTEQLGNSYRVMDPNRLSIQSFGDEPLPGISVPINFNSTKPSTAIVTQGYGGLDISGINIIGAQVGLLVGMARPLDGKTMRTDANTNWTQPLYACASALKATVRRVTFSINGTSIADLTVESASHRSEDRLWGVENSKWLIRDTTPLWGLVDDKYEDAPGLDTIRSDRLYLPAGSASTSTIGVSSPSDAMAGVVGLQAVLRDAYSEALTSLRSDTLPDYTGVNNYPIYARWQNLSRSADTAPTIINLVWADIAANAVMSSKSRLSQTDSQPDAQSAMESVMVFERVIRYQWRYAIPGAIFLVLWLGIGTGILMVVLFAGTRLADIRQLVNQTATGRAITNVVYPGLCAPGAPTKQWVETAGGRVIELRRGGDANFVETEDMNLVPKR